MAQRGDVHHPEQRFGFVEIKDTCSSPGCGKPAVACLPMVTEEDGAGVFWQCHEHALAVNDEFKSKGLEGLSSQQIVRTCQVEVGKSPCGAAATHMAIVGVHIDGKPELAASSTCRRHTERGED